jgi:hyperosmotically inducible protein
MKMKRIQLLYAVLFVGILTLGVACSDKTNVAQKDNVENALKQADIKGVTVSEDRDKNLITLGGTLHSEEAKAKAGDVAKSAAGSRIIANEIGIQPLGNEGDAKAIASNVDDAIEKNYKAALIANNLKADHIRYDSKNGVLTLKGKVKTTKDRQDAQQIASSVPNVQQVVNEIEVSR